MTACVFDPADALGAEWREGRWIGRIDRGEGPCPVLVVDGIVHDMSRVAPTVADLVAAAAFDPAAGEAIGALDAIGLSVDGPVRLLSPIDLQCVKAAGVTFAVSAMERVIEERARGDSSAAAEVRGRLEGRIGGSMRAVVPGSPEAAALKQALIDEGLWSQYLEVAIGPDAEIFTKSPVLSTVGWGADVGVRSDSTWNNPEPEVVLLVDARARRWARHWATTSTCAISKGDRRCCWARRRTITRPAHWARSCACSTTSSRWTTSARPRSRCGSRAPTAIRWMAAAR